MLYSSLEEAYNIPSVKPKKKVKESFKNKCSGENDYYTSNYKINLCNNDEKKINTNEVSGNEVSGNEIPGNEVRGVKEQFNNYKASNQCETLQAPAYRYPLINDDDKEKVNKVLEKRGGDDINFDDNMGDIKSYVEDDLDMYFEYEDKINENKVTNEVQEKAENKVQEMKEEDGRLIIRPKKNKKKNIEISEKWMDKLMELLLLLLLGIFIILLLEILINLK
jgi:hypothetical protein